MTDDDDVKMISPPKNMQVIVLNVDSAPLSVRALVGYPSRFLADEAPSLRAEQVSSYVDVEVE
jgi:hypothetical protein